MNANNWNLVSSILEMIIFDLFEEGYDIVLDKDEQGSDIVKILYHKDEPFSNLLELEKILKNHNFYQVKKEIKYRAGEEFVFYPHVQGFFEYNKGL